MLHKRSSFFFVAVLLVSVLIQNDLGVGAGEVNVETFKGVVQLSGFVEDATPRRRR